MKIAMPNQRGTNVIVRDIKRQYHVRRVWDFDEDAVYVTDESGHQKLSLGQKVVPVEFPRQDVFEYDEDAVATAVSAALPPCRLSSLPSVRRSQVSAPDAVTRLLS